MMPLLLCRTNHTDDAAIIQNTKATSASSKARSVKLKKRNEKKDEKIARDRALIVAGFQLGKLSTTDPLF